MDTTIVMICSITIAAASAQLVTPEAMASRVLILMPLIGSVVIMGGAIMLNPSLETRKITIGRAFFGLLFGVGGPYAISSLLEYWNMLGLQRLLLQPGMLLFEGVFLSWVAFWLSRPFTRRFYERSDAMAGREVDRIERLQRMAGRPPEQD